MCAPLYDMLCRLKIFCWNCLVHLTELELVRWDPGKRSWLALLVTARLGIEASRIHAHAASAICTQRGKNK